MNNFSGISNFALLVCTKNRTEKKRANIAQVS